MNEKINSRHTRRQAPGEGAPPDWGSKSQETARFEAGLALIDAAQRGDLEKVRQLLPMADCSFQDRNENNALHAAAIFGHEECLRELLPHFDAKKRGAEGQTALMIAAGARWPEGVKLLLPQSEPHATNEAGWTALMYSVHAGRVAEHPGWRAECARMILPVSDAKTLDKEGRSALFWAAQAGNAECVGMLLPFSDPLVATQNGITPLMIGAWSGVEEVVAALLPVSNARAVNKNGATALMFAASSGLEHGTRLLLGVSDLHARDNSGISALDRAQAFRDPKVAKNLASMIQEQMALNERAELAGAVSEVGGSKQGRAGQAAQDGADSVARVGTAEEEPIVPRRSPKML